jgi:hypothetical protein
MGKPVALADGRILKWDGLVRGTTGALPGDPGMVAQRYLGPDGLVVLVSIDAHPFFGSLLHVSISYAKRDPKWQTLYQVKRAFFGDTLDAAMILPRARDFVHGVPGWEDSHVFHLYQLPERWGTL